MRPRPARVTTAIPDVTTAAARLRAAEASPIALRRVTVLADIAALQTSIAQRRAELAADDNLLAARFAEFAALEQADHARARALAPPAPAFLSLKKACQVAGCGEATMRSKIRRHGFGWLVEGRWRISEPDLIAHLAGIDRDDAF